LGNGHLKALGDDLQRSQARLPFSPFQVRQKAPIHAQVNCQVCLRHPAFEPQFPQPLAEPDADIIPGTRHAPIMAVGFRLRVGHALHHPCWAHVLENRRCDHGWGEYMNRFAAAAVILGLSVSVSAQVSGKARSTRAIRPEVQACRDRIKELVSLNDHFDALTPEKITSVQKEVNDCVYAESAGLSKDDIIAAYKLRDGTGREAMKRIREAAEKTLADDNTLREAARKIAQGFLDEDKAYKGLVERYNGVVDSYNSLLREYRANVEENGRFLDRMQETIREDNQNCQVNTLQTLVNSATRSRPSVVYKPPAQIHCTTQNMPAPVAGLPSWTYTNCY